MKQHDFVPLVTFRGWISKDKKWIHGAYIKWKNLTFIAVPSGNYFVDTPLGEVFNIVEKDSLGIYTGKNDKHGNPIFCGVAGAKYGSDIVRMWNGNKSQVRYARSVFHTGKLDYKFSQIIRPGGLEVIGNQYEQHLKEQQCSK